MYNSWYRYGVHLSLGTQLCSHATFQTFTCFPTIARSNAVANQSLSIVSVDTFERSTADFFASDLVLSSNVLSILFPSIHSLVDKAPLLYLLKDENASVSRGRFVFPCLETCTLFLLLPKM